MTEILRLKATLEETISFVSIESSFMAFYGKLTLFNKVNKAKIRNAFAQEGPTLTGDR